MGFRWTPKILSSSVPLWSCHWWVTLHLLTRDSQFIMIMKKINKTIEYTCPYGTTNCPVIHDRWHQHIVTGEEKHSSPSPRTSHKPFKHSANRAIEPHSQTVTISPCLIRWVPRIWSEQCWNQLDSPFAACSPSTDPHCATKYHRGGKSTWLNRDLNPGLFQIVRALLSTVTELPPVIVYLHMRDKSI